MKNFRDFCHALLAKPTDCNHPSLLRDRAGVWEHRPLGFVAKERPWVRRAKGFSGKPMACAVFFLAVCPLVAQLFLPSSENDLDTGAKVAKLVEEQVGLYNTPNTEDYVRQIGERLVS